MCGVKADGASGAGTHGALPDFAAKRVPRACARIHHDYYSVLCFVLVLSLVLCLLCLAKNSPAIEKYLLKPGKELMARKRDG